VPPKPTAACTFGGSDIAALVTCFVKIPIEEVCHFLSGVCGTALLIPTTPKAVPEIV
jgi:hypothetical protein